MCLGWHSRADTCVVGVPVVQEGVRMRKQNKGGEKVTGFLSAVAAASAGNMTSADMKAAFLGVVHPFVGKVLFA